MANQQARKQLYESLSEIDKPVTAGNVHCFLQEVSPIKKARSGVNYYYGMATDGTKSMRFVGFDKTSRDNLSIYYDKQQPVQLQNCVIKKAHTADDLEIQPSTKILKSPIKFNTNAIQFHSTAEAIKVPNEIDIQDIQDIDDGKFVSVNIKVINVALHRVVSTGVLQEVIIADTTGTLNLCLWDNTIDQLEKDKCCSLNNECIRRYYGVKSLSTSSNSMIKEIDNFDAPADTSTSTSVKIIKSAEIVGTQNFHLHYSCINCNNRIEIISGTTAL